MIGQYLRIPAHEPAARQDSTASARAVKRAYRMTIERAAVFSSPQPTTAPSSPEPTADREIELE
jgi:hypothetical protein